MSTIEGYEVVFEGVGYAHGWSIIKDKAQPGVLASHVLCTEDLDEVDEEGKLPEQGIMSWFHNEERAVCYYCNAPVPAEIQALIHLSSSF